MSSNSSLRAPWRAVPARVGAVLLVLVALVVPVSPAVADSADPAGAADGEQAPAASGGVRVTVTIPPGSLSVSSSALVQREAFHVRATTVRVVVTDTRAGDLGFSLSATARGGSPSVAVVTGVRVEQVPGNALDPRDVAVGGGVVGPRGGSTIASYPAGLGLGSVVVTAVVLTPALGPDDVDVVWTVL